MAGMALEIKKVVLLLVATLFSYVFVASGLLVGFLSILLLVIWPFSKNVYRIITSGLAYSVLGQLVWVSIDYADLRVHIFGTKKAYEKLGNEFHFITSSHRGDLDWVAGFVLAANYGCLHSVRSLPKRSVLFIPGFGQLLWALDYLFLRRNNYQKDKETITKMGQRYRTYSFPIQVAIYCEGTRFTQEKHKKGQEYAKKHNLPLLKHHVTPRTKGFALLIECLRGGGIFKAVYDVGVAYPDWTNDWVPTHLDILLGKRVDLYWYMRRIPMEDLPTSNEDLNKFCYQLFQHKDEAYEHFLQNGEFPAPRQPRPTFNHIRFKLRLLTFTWGLLLTVVPLVVMCLTLPLKTICLVLAGWGSFNALLFAVLLISNKGRDSKEMLPKYSVLKKTD